MTTEFTEITKLHDGVSVHHDFKRILHNRLGELCVLCGPRFRTPTKERVIPKNLA